MELSNPNIKKIIIFSQKKPFLIFPEMEPCTSQPKLENFLYFKKRKPQKNFLYFLKRKLFLCFEKWKPSKTSYFRK